MRNKRVDGNNKQQQAQVEGGMRRKGDDCMGRKNGKAWRYNINQI